MYRRAAIGTLSTTISQNIAQKLDIVTDATRNGASNSSRALRIPAESSGRTILDYFDQVGLETEPTPFDGRSDYGPFITPEAFVPAGGLFSGAEGVKTEEEAATYGGAAGSWYDPCYHQACDTFSTVVYQPPFVAGDPEASADGLEEGSEAADAALMRGNGPIGLGQLADAAADATWTLARSRSPLVGPATARVASARSARRSYRKAFRRAAKHQDWKGGRVIR